MSLINNTCKQCIKEAQSLLQQKGYSYGYLGTEGNCIRHHPQHTTSHHNPPKQCEKCLKTINDFNNGLISYCNDYIGIKGKCVFHDHTTQKTNNEPQPFNSTTFY